MLGLAMSRYVIKLEPIASASPADLAATVGPTLDRYLTGPIGNGRAVSDDASVRTPARFGRLEVTRR